MTRTKEHLPALNSKIVQEAKHWLRTNKGVTIGKGCYSSPRVSSEIPDCSMPLTFDQYNVCSLGCMYCAVTGTKIATVTGQRNVETLEVGNTVFSRNLETNKIVLDTITATMERTVSEILQIIVEDGTTVEITAEHPVYVKGFGWKLAKDLQKKDDLDISKNPGSSYYMQHHNPMKITKIAKKTGNFRVHNFETAKYNNYFANSILVHNCFSYIFKLNNPANKGGVHLKSINVNKLLDDIDGKFPNNAYYRHFYSKRFLLHWGGLADPFCNFESHNKVGLRFMRGLGKRNYPTLFSFKGSAIHNKHYIHLLEKFADQSNFAFQSSIVTNDDELAKRVEIGVASTTERLKTLKMLSDMGYWTILRLRPFIPGVTDIGLDELLERALEAGINAISTEWFALDVRAASEVKERYAWLSKIIGVPDLMEYYKRLSPSTRGSYRRLNRLVKEPYVKQIYQFCIKHNLVCGISDPDFKELNTSGSCCGMPDHFPKNRELENWTTSQMTYHIKEARKTYHSTGEKVVLKFSTVYANDAAYLDDRMLSQDHIGVIGMPNAVRHNITLRMILQKQWNNLKSPANPRNYFHGKVMPCTELDSDGNLMFKYIPLDYEKRWAEEGIDLTR